MFAFYHKLIFRRFVGQKIILAIIILFIMYFPHDFRFQYVDVLPASVLLWPYYISICTLHSYIHHACCATVPS